MGPARFRRLAMSPVMAWLRVRDAAGKRVGHSAADTGCGKRTADAARFPGARFHFGPEAEPGLSSAPHREAWAA